MHRNMIGMQRSLALQMGMRAAAELNARAAAETYEPDARDLRADADRILDTLIERSAGWDDGYA